MLNVLRSGLRRAAHAPGQARTSAARVSLWTQARVPSGGARTAALSVVAAAAALSGVMMYGGAVRLDSADSPKPKPRVKPVTKQPEENTPSELPQTSAAEADSVILTSDVDADANATGSPEDGADTEADGDAGSGSGGAYNPETGEINWDCPCLGGMAHGPCGQEFRAAFSCFVYSEDEPKGINCVELFKQMQDCFRAHPEVYGEEIMADDEEDGAPAPAPAGGAGSLDGNSEPVPTPAPGPELVPVPVSSSS
ncbi:hypothetical protein M0805_002048 [Coniferiporia weirii]|nr:hypothetical protein M0805_002048 [Coniferiporia weirii]